MTEEIDKEEKIYRERLLYGSELMHRIGQVLNACENHQSGYEPMMNLRAFLLPQIKNEIASQVAGLRVGYNNFVKRLPQPVMNIPIQARRPVGYGSPVFRQAGRFDHLIIRPPDSSHCFMRSQSREKLLYWSDFPADVRDIVQYYFVSGQCVQTGLIQQLAFYVFACREIDLIVKSADAHGLLLTPGASVQQGGMSFYNSSEEEDDAGL